MERERERKRGGENGREEEGEREKGERGRGREKDTGSSGDAGWAVGGAETVTKSSERRGNL